MIVWTSAVITLVWYSSDIAAIICKKVPSHQLCTIYSYVFVPYHNLSCFSTAVLLLFAVDSDEMIFLLFDDLSKSVSIAPFFNDTLTLPTLKDPASLLYGWKQSSAKCLLYKLEWSSTVASHLSHVAFSWSAHLFLSRGSLEKPYRCSPSLQVELQPIELSYSLDNSKTTHSSITLHHALPRRCAKYTSSCSPVYVTHKAPPAQKSLKNMLLNNPYFLEKGFGK